MRKVFLALLLSAFSILLFAQTDNNTADIEKQKLEKAKSAKNKEIIIKGKQDQPGVVTVIDEKAVNGLFL